LLTEPNYWHRWRLRVRRERPRRRAAESDELASPQVRELHSVPTKPRLRTRVNSDFLISAAHSLGSNFTRFCEDRYLRRILTAVYHMLEGGQSAPRGADLPPRQTSHRTRFFRRTQTRGGHIMANQFRRRRKSRQD
jgi:hypothetical protein